MNKKLQRILKDQGFETDGLLSIRRFTGGKLEFIADDEQVSCFRLIKRDETGNMEWKVQFSCTPLELVEAAIAKALEL